MYVRIKELTDLLCVGESTIWYWIKQGKFPKAIKLSPRVSVWKKEDINDWIASKAA